MSNIVIPSRYFLAPINTGYADNGVPTPRFIDFFKKRSGKSIGITYVGNVAIGPAFTTNKNTPYFQKSSYKAWRQLTAQIKKNGSIPGVQLACRYSDSDPLRSWINPDKEQFISRTRQFLSTMSSQQIEEIRDKFILSAEIALDLGFEVIQIHAAHGYFLSLMIDPKFNERTDDYGRDKTLIIKDIITKSRELDSKFLLDIRVSLYDGVDDASIEIKRKSVLFDSLSNLPLNLISISNGIYDYDKQLIYPPLAIGHGPYLPDAIKFAQKYPHLTWNIAGNIWDVQQMPRVPHNLTFSVGRALIADPSWVAKSMQGEFESILSCNRDNSCHYYTNGTSELRCTRSYYEWRGHGQFF